MVIYSILTIVSLIFSLILSKILFHKKIKTTQYIYTFLLSFILIPILVISSILIIFQLSTEIPNKKFIQSVWLSNKSSRIGFTKDINQNKYLENKNKTEVIKLLGEPDKKEISYFIYELSNYVWWRKGFVTIYLMIEFKDDIVISYETVYD